MTTRTRVLVSGRVQGVFFRASVRDTARSHGLTGWVRNRPDGRVEAELQGPDTAVERTIAWCRQGPPLARVIDVEVTTLDPVDGETGFRVR
jgi:acylphosphatase